MPYKNKEDRQKWKRANADSEKRSRRKYYAKTVKGQTLEQHAVEVAARTAEKLYRQGLAAFSSAGKEVHTFEEWALHKDEKYCNGCSQWKSRAEFSRDASNSTGLDSQCKDCRSQYQQTIDPEYWSQYRKKKWQDPVWAEKERWRNKERGSHKIELGRENFMMLMSLQRGLCFYCGCPLSSLPDTDQTVDLMLAKKKGGIVEQDNCVIACRSCNSTKQDTMQPDEAWAYITVKRSKCAYIKD